jgi:hypothetical protein
LPQFPLALGAAEHLGIDWVDIGHVKGTISHGGRGVHRKKVGRRVPSRP